MGIAEIRATHVHDRLDSTHDALHHGCYLCVYERVTAYSSRHVTDIRHVMTDSREAPPAARTMAAWRTHRQGGPDGDGQSHRTHGEADEGRCGEALLGARHQHHHAINMFLKQAVREQGIPFEVAARPAIECDSESVEKQPACPSRRPPRSQSPLA